MIATATVVLVSTMIGSQVGLAALHLVEGRGREAAVAGLLAVVNVLVFWR